MKTILVVDDMSVIREPICAALRAKGFHAVTAGDGREGMDAARKHKPDAILLDLSMPGMDGISMLRAVRCDPHLAGVPVVVLTAVIDKDAVMAAGKLGVAGYLLKSQFSLKEMLARVEKALSTVPRDKAGEAAVGAAPGRLTTDKPTNVSSTVGGSAGTGTGAAGGADSPAQPASVPTQAVTPADAAAMVNMPRRSAADTDADVLRQMKPLMTRSQIEEHIDQSGEISALSPIVSQLIKLTSSEGCSIEQVARTIRQDQAIALRVLKLANSVVYTRGEPVESVQKAVMRIGLSQIRQVVLNISVIERFASTADHELFNVPMFWEHSIATGLLAAAICRAIGGKEQDIDSAFTMGLLHDVGKMVYLDQFRENYELVLRTARDLQLPLERVETRMMMVNHADLMDRLLHVWKFPKHLINPIALHHLSLGNIRHLSPRMVNEIGTLALANRLAHAMMLGSSGNDALYSTDEFVTALGLKPDQLRELETIIPDQTQDLKFAMLNSSQGGHWPDRRSQERKALGVPVRPIVIAPKPSISALRIWADAMAQQLDEQPPNIVLVHMAQGRDRAPLTRALEQAEQTAGVAKLPTVVLSPTGTLSLDTAAASGRRVEMLAEPLAVARLSERIAAMLALDTAEAAMPAGLAG